MTRPTLRALRAHAVARSLRPPPTSPRRLPRWRFVQLDPIRAPARAADLILRQRVAGYRAGDLDRAYPALRPCRGLPARLRRDAAQRPAISCIRAAHRFGFGSSASIRGSRRAFSRISRDHGETHPRDLDALAGIARPAAGATNRSRPPACSRRCTSAASCASCAASTASRFTRSRRACDSRNRPRPRAPGAPALAARPLRDRFPSRRCDSSRAWWPRARCPPALCDACVRENARGATTSSASTSTARRGLRPAGEALELESNSAGSLSRAVRPDRVGSPPLRATSGAGTTASRRTRRPPSASSATTRCRSCGATTSSAGPTRARTARPCVSRSASCARPRATPRSGASSTPKSSACASASAREHAELRRCT